MIFNKNPIAI